MDWVTPLAQARDAGITPGLRSAQLLDHGTMKLRFYQPREEDEQTPHDQDELYIVITGSGTFAIGHGEDSLERIPFGPGDAIFAPAGAVHRFEDFTNNIATWVIFWGPQGGEKPTKSTTVS